MGCKVGSGCSAECRAREKGKSLLKMVGRRSGRSRSGVTVDGGGKGSRLRDVLEKSDCSGPVVKF